MNELTPKILELKKKVRTFIKTHIDPIVREADINEQLPKSVLKAWKDIGLSCMVAPKEYGGPELDTLSCAVVMEELGYSCLGVATALGANNLSSYPVILAGTPEQKKKFFKTLLDGNYGAFALTEPGAGSDISAIATTARKEGNEYILNGTKTFITEGGQAAIYIVFASTDRSKAHKGISAFIVEKERPGINIGKIESKLGIRASDTVEIIFNDVRIPESNLLGNEGEGIRLALTSLDSGRIMVAAQAIGAAQRAMDECLKYTANCLDKKNILTGEQQIAFKIADMATSIEAGRLLVYECAKLKDRGQLSPRHAAITKLFCTDTAIKVANEALDIIGIYGYTSDMYIEKVWRDARILSIYEGTNQIQRIVIANELMREYGYR